MDRLEAISIVKGNAVSMTIGARINNDMVMGLYAEALTIVVREAETNIMMEAINKSEPEEKKDDNKEM